MLSNKARSSGVHKTGTLQDNDEDHGQTLAGPPMIERSVYTPSSSSRTVGFIGTGAILTIVMAGFFLIVTPVVPVATPSAMTVFEVQPRTPPHETPPEKKEAPRPVEQKEMPPELTKTQPIERTIVPIVPLPVSVAVTTIKPIDPRPAEPETAAPRTQPAPLAPKMSADASRTWEGRVLARLNEHRRYPRSAMARRHHGVPYVRFVMDREGRVLSVTLERSSGFPELDREAVTLPGRAQPLPKPPDDVRPGQTTIELVVPVEYFMRR